MDDYRYYEDLLGRLTYEAKPEKRPGTEPVYRWDKINGVWLPTHYSAGRYRYYLESPSSKGDMVKDIFLDLAVTALELSSEMPKMGVDSPMKDLSAFDIRAEFSYFYGNDDPATRRGNHYKCYEWEGAIFCARLADEEQKRAVEEYNQLSGGKSSVFIDERRSNHELGRGIDDMWNALKKAKSYEQIETLVFDALDSFGLRSYESERPAKRHYYSRYAVSNRWRNEANRRIREERRELKEDWRAYKANR